MIRNIIKAGVLLISALMSASCSESILDERLYSDVGKDNLNNESGAVMLTNGIYKQVRYFSYFGGNNYVMNTEANSDDFYCSWGNVDATSWGGAQNMLNMDAGHSMAQTNWESIYKVIAQCNEVINLYGDSEYAKVKECVGEARFWRAYAYDRMFRLFGPVPLITGNEDTSNGIERASEENLKKFIEVDYNAAYTVLPAKRTTEEAGRPSKYAVSAAFARYYLNNKDWSNAAKYAKDVIDNGGFALDTDYPDIFSNDANPETILAISNINESQLGNKYIALVMHSGLIQWLGLTGVAGSNGYGMATSFYKTFASNDKRVAPYDKNTKTGIAVTGVIYNDDGTPVFGSKENPQSVEDFLHRVPTFKWPIQQNIPNGEDASYDFPLLRLGETYLTYAEALNELGNTQEAAKYVNTIRQRAGLDALPTSMNQEQMRNVIIDERGWELYHEGYRREDLVRTGKLLEKVNEKYKFYLGTDMPWKDDQNRLLQPIPTSALLLNSKLKQNPGY